MEVSEKMGITEKKNLCKRKTKTKRHIDAGNKRKKKERERIGGKPASI